MAAVLEESDILPAACSLSRYILTKDIDAVHRILRERNKNPVPLTVDNRGWTALHIAASADEYADYLELLVCNKNTLLLDLDGRTHQDETALYIACERGCTKNCAILLKSSCNPELPTWFMTTPLHIASKNGHVAIVSQLIARSVNSDPKDQRGRPPSYLAYKHPQVQRVLSISEQVNVRMSDALAPDMYSDSPLHLASRLGHLEVLKTLLQADCSLVDMCNQDGFTPLMLAAQSRHVKCVKYLLGCGASANRCSNKHMTSLQYAARSGNKQVLELVLEATSLTFTREHMLRIPNVIIDSGNGVSNSLMSCVIQSGSPDCMSVLLKSDLPKGILEAPYIKKLNSKVSVFSPIAFLFSKFILDNIDSGIRDEFLHLLLQHSITHLNEFFQLIGWRSYLYYSYFVNPLQCIYDEPPSFEKRYHYLNMLIENGITPDFFLQCSLQCSSECTLQHLVKYNKYNDRPITFQDFESCICISYGNAYMFMFYSLLTSAIDRDNIELVELFMSNSAVLEPFHLWNHLYNQRLPRDIPNSFRPHPSWSRGDMLLKMNPKVTNYLINFGVDSNAYKNMQSYLPRDAPTLKELCRHAIRKSLRELTLHDNINNFKENINSLPLPKSLRNYLHFKTR